MDLLDNKYFTTGISVFLAMYAGVLAPKLPNGLARLLKTDIARVLIIALVAFLANRDPQLSLMIAVAFVVSLNVVSERMVCKKLEKMEGFFENIDEEGEDDDEDKLKPMQPQEGFYAEQEANVRSYDRAPQAPREEEEEDEEAAFMNKQNPGQEYEEDGGVERFGETGAYNNFNTNDFAAF